MLAFIVICVPNEAILPPGEFIRQELQKRGWGQADLAKILDRPLPTVNEIIQGKRAIMPEMAVDLGSAFETGPEIWIQRESSYRLSLVDQSAPEVQRRAKLFELAPIKDMQKRGWIRPKDSIADLEKELCSFFNIPNLDAEIKLHANARQPFKTESLSRSQIAWCVRAGKLASVVDAERFDANVFKAALPEIRKLADYSDKAKHLSRVLALAGVRLAVVEPLPHSPIDGAAFWLADDAPVIALSARFDRIDCVWFTLAHEMMHILHQDAQSVDLDLVGESSATDLEEIEARANRDAAAFLVPEDKLKSFIIRVKPFYSKERIVQFAHRMHVHPGIVSGQLQFHREIGWHANREMLAKVRNHLITSAITDGWGQTVPAI